VDVSPVNTLFDGDGSAVAAHMPALQAENLSGPHPCENCKVGDGSLAEFEHAKILFCLLSCHCAGGHDRCLFRGVKGGGGIALDVKEGINGLGASRPPIATQCHQCVASRFVPAV